MSSGKVIVMVTVMFMVREQRTMWKGQGLEIKLVIRVMVRKKGLPLWP